ERKRKYLDQLIRNYNTYLDTLFELDAAERQLIQETEAFTKYIDEQVLWIRSSKPLPTAIRLSREAFWVFRPGDWFGLITALGRDVRAVPVVYGVALLLMGVLLRPRRRIRKELASIGHQAAKGTFREFRPTLRAAMLTLLMALPWPAFLMFLGWRLNEASDGNGFVASIAVATFKAAIFFFPLELLRQICRDDGLAEAHFDWTDRAVRVLRANLRWLIAAGVPLLFLSAAMNEMAEPGQDWVGRVFFIATAVVLTVFLSRVLHPSSGVFRELIAYHPGGWMDRLKYLWFALAMLSPLLLAALAFFGYDYTARELGLRLLITLWFVLALVLLRAFLSRWLLLRRRRIAMEQARQRRAAAAEAAAQADSTSQAPSARQPVPVSPEQPQPDLSSLSEQTQRLMHAGLTIIALIGVWMIWVDVLPALHFLDRWTIWTTSVQVTEERPDTPGGQVTRTIVKQVTVSHLALCILIAFATAVAAKNVPGLMEMALLERLPFDASTRYAITSLTQYAIVIVGIVLAFGAIGIGWSKVQWIATALTFGLAFGLQEIFANFVAGLILLFERPIRVGDVVTVDDVTGVVSRIRIRATTITNWDRKEFIIPNKDFITGRLLNWTLSDKVNRIVIQVGVAYGSDTDLVQKLLLKVVNEHPLILEEPAPSAIFDGFGDSTLNFTVRCYLPNLDNRLTVTHELHTAIDRAFRAAGIEIAFPQRDLHIRSVPESLTSKLSDALSGSAEPTPGLDHSSD
ncbi:MAG: mechanosensitive ion channel, partial [Planctomycetes bacterium]|nr:mechanosensitive ion channel [Planctomycetota bacterium]